MARQTINRIWQFGSFFRLPLFGWSLAMPVLGVLTVSSSPGVRAIVPLCMTVPFHVVAGVLNDLASIELDRRDPRKARRPLVAGAISPVIAWALVIIAAVMAFPVDAVLLGFDPARSAALAVALAATAGYNILGKRTRVPPLMDLLLGVGSAAFVHYAALAVGSPTAITILVELAVIIYMTLDNGVHFGVRDLKSDLEYGARTTPIAFGVTPRDDAPYLPAKFIVYAVTLQVLLTIVTLVPIAVGLSSHQVARSAGLVACVFAVGSYIFIYPSIDADISDSARYVNAGIQSLCAFGSIAAVATGKYGALPILGVVALVAAPLGAKRVISASRTFLLPARQT